MTRKINWQIGLLTLLLIASGVGLYMFAAQEIGLNGGYWIDPSPTPIKIIHVCNWRWVQKESFANGLRQSEPDLTDEQIGDRFTAFLADIEELQREQVEVIRKLSTDHGLRSVFYEGLTPDNLEVFNKANKRVKRLNSVNTIANALGNGDQPRSAEEFREKAKRLMSEMRQESVQLGAIGHLIRVDALDAAIPLETDATLDAANPISADGQLKFDSAAGRAREGVMVRRLLEGGPVAIVVLDGKHDLTDALKATGRPFTYERVETPTYTKLAK